LSATVLRPPSGSAKPPTAASPRPNADLALAYEIGRGVAKDEASARKWYRAAATDKAEGNRTIPGYARARYNLALMLEDGRGSPVDQAAAAQLYRAAALQNFAPLAEQLRYHARRGPRWVESRSCRGLRVALPRHRNGAKPIARDLLVRQLSPAQLETANKRFAALRAQFDARPPSAAVAAAPAPEQPATPPAAAAPAPVSAPTPTPTAPDPALVANVAALDQARAENARLVAENTRLAAAIKSAGTERAALDQRLAAATAETAKTAQALTAAEAAAKTAAARPTRPEPGRSRRPRGPNRRRPELLPTPPTRKTPNSSPRTPALPPPRRHSRRRKPPSTNASPPP